MCASQEKRLAPADNPLCWGHGEAQDRFLQHMQTGRLPHGWLLVGPPGVGKRTFAYQVIRLLFSGASHWDAMDLPVSSPLFRRISCQTHGDLLVIEPEEKRSIIPVERVRRLVSFLSQTTMEGGWRIVLLDGVDRLNRQGANALLKSLEEPPPKTLLLLTAESLGGVLPTVRSRCQVLALKPLSDTLMHEGLLSLGFSVEKRNFPIEALSLAGGCLGQALRLLHAERLSVILELRSSLARACLPPAHPAYVLWVPSAAVKTLIQEDFDGASAVVCHWLSQLLLQGYRKVLPDLEQAVFSRYPLVVWWHLWDIMTEQFRQGQALSLEPSHVFAGVLGRLTQSEGA